MGSEQQTPEEEFFESIASDLYSEVTDSLRKTLLQQAQKRITPGGYGKDVTEARGWALAHYASMLKRDVEHGAQETQISTDQVTRSFKEMSSDEQFAQTKYGLQVIDLQNQNDFGFGPAIT
jgi:hypothetical protein